MELLEPKPKRYCRLPQSLPLPIVMKKDGSIKKFSAIFNGFSVTLCNPEDMITIISMGYFGKANFSRSYPQATNENEPKIIRERQFNHRCNYSKTKKKAEKVIVIPDSDSENEDYFIDLKPKFELDYSELQEKVWLSLEEAFFLASVIDCLVISYKSEYLNNEKLWNIFSETQNNFIRNYVVYYYYRAKNWVVKPGIKFGGDFLLYKQGPPFYHASYVVVIEPTDEKSKTSTISENKVIDNVSLFGLNRLCETAGKELIICRLKWPSEIDYNNLQYIEIQEILIRRWVPSQEREEI